MENQTLTKTFRANDKVFKTDEETLEVLRSVYNSDPDNITFKYVIYQGLQFGCIVEITA